MAGASSLAPMAPTSPQSSRTSEPSLTITVMEKVKTPPAQVPPKFVFGTGSGSSSFEFDPPHRSTSAYHHPKYYMGTDMVVFQVDIQIGVLTGSLTYPPFRSTAVCTAYINTSSCQRLGSSRICSPFHSPLTKVRRKLRKGQQTTPRSRSLMSLARNLRPSWISSTIGSYCQIISVLGTHCDNLERVRRKR